jgi:hypothetical protein
MNERQRLALTRPLDSAEGAPPADLTVTRRHKPTGFTIMSLLAVDR